MIKYLYYDGFRFPFRTSPEPDGEVYAKEVPKICLPLYFWIPCDYHLPYRVPTMGDTATAGTHQGSHLEEKSG